VFCERCNRFTTQAATKYHAYGHTLTDLGAVMTQPNPDQATLDNLTDALTTAYPILQAAVAGSSPVAALNFDSVIAIAQQIVDLTKTSADQPIS
jgi:hypothetical protein